MINDEKLNRILKKMVVNEFLGFYSWGSRMRS